MHALAQKLFPACVLLLPLAAALSPVLNAQNADVEDGPPKVLVIHREYLKPGKGGMLHDRSESAFVHAFADAKSPYHYFGLDSLSGVSRSLFLFSYDSFADWEKETAAIGSNKALAAKVDQASLMDGDLLASYDAAAMTLRPDLSLNKGSIDGARYFEITTFVVKPGPHARLRRTRPPIHRHLPENRSRDPLGHLRSHVWKPLAHGRWRRRLPRHQPDEVSRRNRQEHPEL